jgi:TolB protein
MMRQVRRQAGSILCIITVSVLAACQSSQETNGEGSPAYAIAFSNFADQNTDVFIADPDGGNARTLSPHPASDYNASFSTDGEWIVFTSERNGAADIFRMRPDGSALQRLTDDLAYDDQAALSPDGQSLAFVSSRSGNADIWIMDMRTKTLRNLTGNPGGDFRPAWSPDGEWLAFSSDRDSPRTHAGFATLQSNEIYVVRKDSSGLRRITTSGKYAGSPSWSADGKSLVAYEAELNEMNRIISARRLTGTTQIVSIDVATGEKRVLTSGAGEKWSPRILADGRIGFAKGGAEPAVAFVDGQAGAKGQVRAPSWSRDGRRMVFHREMTAAWPPHGPVWSRDKRYRLVRTGVFASYSPDGRELVVNDGTAGAVHNNIWKYSADGAQRTMLVTHPEKSALAPSWSPRGGKIAFALGQFFPGQQGVVPASIAIANTDGSQVELITPDTENAGFPAWSPDERFLVYRVSNGQRSGLRIIEIASRQIRVLTDGANDNSPSWSPKSDRIVFTSKRGADSDYDIYTIRPDGSDLRRLTRGPGNNSHPAWSPDGEWIAFTGSGQGFKDEAALHPFNPQPYGEIMVMRGDGSDVRILTDNQFEDGTPTWIAR